MDIRVAAYVVLVRDSGVLLAHWSEGGRSGWTMPGGQLEPGEDPADAAVREAFEETGYDVELGGLLGIGSRVVPGELRLAEGREGIPLHNLQIVYRGRVVGGSLRVEVDGTTDDARWIPLDDVRDLDRVELVDLALGLAGLL